MLFRSPLPNLWLLASVSDQRTADELIPDLLRCRPHAAVLGVSYEPALGPVDWSRWLASRWPALACECRMPPTERESTTDINGCPMCPMCGTKLGGAPRSALDWIIAGGESGPDARPCHAEWIRSTIRQCRNAEMACFIKQLGAASSDPLNGIAGGRLKVHPDAEALVTWRLRDAKGADPDEWPADLWVQQWPDGRSS